MKGFIKGSGFRRVVVWISMLLCAAIVAISGIGYGIYLHKTKQAKTLSEWVNGIRQQKLAVISNYVSGLRAEPKKITVSIDPMSFEKIVLQRELALRVGNKWRMHPKNPGKVPATIFFEQDTLMASVRLKGGQIDHWAHKTKWSFKFKLKGGGRMLGMKRFSIQHPWTREYLNEWVFHKLLKDNGLIALRYYFVEATLNDKDLGIYALEENMSKELLENNERREGPIINYNSDYIWASNLANANYWNSASINVYSKKSKLMQQFTVARNLLEAFRRGQLKPHEVFDIKKLAKLFAIVDLTGNHHSLILGNIKFYYNPINSLIEPIGYDNGWYFPLEWERLVGLGYEINLSNEGNVRYNNWHAALFSDEMFVREYISALAEISQREYLDDFFAGIDDELNEQLKILYKSFPWYSFEPSKKMLYRNQELIRKTLHPVIAVQPYFNAYHADRRCLELGFGNSYSLPVEVLSISIDNSTHIKASDRIVLQPAKQKPLDFKVQCFKLPEGFEWHEYLAKRISVNYEIVGATGILKAKCHKWSQPQIDFFSKDIIRRKPNVEEFNFLLKDEDAKTITIKEGNWNIRQTLIVPKDYVLKGTGNIKLNLLNKSMILSYSPIELIGSEKHPVEIYSTDSTGMGILVMNSGSASLLKQVRFNNLSNPSENDWQVTGAITFYQAPLKIEHCGFYQNRSEDALNIVRSGFAMENCLFSGASSDAFDTDFSSGTISGTSFINCGNDAIDISGGQVSVSDVLIEHPGDKGVSVGENGRMSIDKIEIRNAELAITSKDKSDVEIHDVRIIKSRVGFVVFEKKAEYGPASVSVEGFRYEDLEVPYLLEKNSTLTIDGESMKPGDYKVKDMLYGIKYGKSSK